MTIELDERGRKIWISELGGTSIYKYSHLKEESMAGQEIADEAHSDAQASNYLYIVRVS